MPPLRIGWIKLADELALAEFVNQSQPALRLEWFRTRTGDVLFLTTRTVDAHVLRLRQKFEPDPEHRAYILTVHGQGYRFAPPA